MIAFAFFCAIIVSFGLGVVFGVSIHKRIIALQLKQIMRSWGRKDVEE
jgi:hypothetical protein